MCYRQWMVSGDYAPVLTDEECSELVKNSEWEQKLADRQMAFQLRKYNKTLDWLQSASAKMVMHAYIDVNISKKSELWGLYTLIGYQVKTDYICNTTVKGYTAYKLIKPQVCVIMQISNNWIDSHMPRRFS